VCSTIDFYPHAPSKGVFGFDEGHWENAANEVALFVEGAEISIRSCSGVAREVIELVDFVWKLIAPVRGKTFVLFAAGRADIGAWWHS